MEHGIGVYEYNITIIFHCFISVIFNLFALLIYYYCKIYLMYINIDKIMIFQHKINNKLYKLYSNNCML